MRKGLLATMVAMTASAGLAFAQPPGQMMPPFPGPTGGLMPGPGGSGLPMAQLPFEGPAGPPPGLLNGMAGDPALGLEGERTYISGDFLLWFIRAQPRFPLVTGGTTISGGVLGELGTTVRFGDQPFDINPFAGGRWTLGTWFRRNPNWGFEWTALVTGQNTETYRLEAQDQVLARPFFDADAGLQSSFLIAFPDFATGNVTARVTAQMWGSEWNFQRKLLGDGRRRLKGIVGVRYFDLHEDLSVESNSFFLPGAATNFYGTPLIAPFAVRVADSFDTRNHYIAGQFGLEGEWRYRRWTFSGGAKLGLGGVYQTLDITGESALRLTAISAENRVLGGVLAVDSNIGRYHHGAFVVMPEGKVQAVYRFAGCLDIGMGYSFLYMSSALRPSLQIDPQVSTTRIPTAAAYSFPGGADRPIIPFTQSGFWVQGLNFTASLKF